MTDLDTLLPPADLAAAMEAGHVGRKTHPTLPLSIYTYTRECQYGHVWTPVTLRCRGLIADDTSGALVALPFPKLFLTAVHGVHDFAPLLPAEPFEIFEKADGSLIIVFHYDGRWHTASKGSFDSDQARWARTVLDAADLTGLDPGLTYLAEAIYPGNRVVVDYGRREDLVLLAAYRPADGSEAPLAAVAPGWTPIGTVVRSWGLCDGLAEVERLAGANTTLTGTAADGTDEEGYVIRYASGVRAKIKFSAYLALHKLFTGTNERTVRDVLASGQDPAVLFDRTPDEFADWTRAVAASLWERHDALVEGAVEEYGRVMAALPADHDRKDFALEVAKTVHRGVLFLLRDERRAAVSEWAWKQVEPRAERPFRNAEE
ncbi:RNA ligase [Streptomyces sp. AM 2-1-1]|uniref:RNA ligase n=1 Tax=Streptomyces sp. AM 2-1-1 TaxID=3028709 RepID=UPI0023B9FD54|nr:RNA ligase [Streptomyces sp. AM 2-1-1]WEH43173.1 RNA ligase [Streptomyces sp. AM 2-1-1]